MLKALTVVNKVPSWVWAASAAVVVLYVIKKGGVANAVQGVTAGVVSGAGGVVKGAGSGVVLGIGDVLGVPRTNYDKCRKAILSADNSSAFSYCTAPQFSKWQMLSLRKKLTGKQFTINDVFN